MIYVVGHRGAPVYQPENTIDSFKKAIEFGVDFIECDVHLSRDEKIVVIHDAMVDRTTDGKGFVKDFNLSELKRLNIRHGDKIPTIEEVLELDFPLFIELKSFRMSGEYQIYPNLLSKLLSVLKDYEFNKDIIFISFDRRYIEQLSNSSFNTIYLSTNFPDLNELEDLNLFGVGIEYHALDPAKLREAHSRSLNVMAWTVDKKEDIEKVIGLKVDFVVSNDPILAIEAIR